VILVTVCHSITDTQSPLWRVSHRVKPIDLLVAGVADRHGAAVLHYDSDYELIAKHTDLSFESVWAFKRGSAG
jgi:predicted nucleic acid-binding protein